MANDFAIGKALEIPQGVLNKIEELDKRINLIASDSEKMATHFMSAMTRMGSGADGLLQKLNSIQNVIGKLDLSKFSQSVATVGQGTTQVEQFASAITKAAEAINKYNKENRKRSDVDNSKQIAQLNKEIEAMRKRTQQLEEYINKQRQANQGGGKHGGSSSTTNADTKALNAYNRAMAASEALVTQRINKIAKLRNAEEQLRSASGNYATQLNRINQEIARLNKLNEGQVDAYGRVIRSQSNLMNTSEQLQRRLALVFSISQITGYIQKLIEVRGEFELQQTALASLLDSKEKADELFSRITDLAVRSPYTIKELNSYTKQLAAYGLEYENLYDTMKRLADVSSGLGVDMQRIILAYGQVRAANVLRGTETRQFTEAGLNILQELSKYYTEVEGKAVSLADVQERQFKRMISFADVEEVFKRITSAGGMFYQMQERQSETLRGLMMNLQDQIDLMLNSVGEANQDVIKDIIGTVKEIVTSWKTIAQVMEPIISSLAIYLSLTKGLPALTGALSTAWANVSKNVGIAIASITRAEVAQRAFNTATRANAWLTVGAIVATAIWEVVNAIKASQEEQEKLNQIVADGYSEAQLSAANYERLANIVTDATASYEEQEKALEELKRTYGEILPQHYLEADAIREMKGNYDEATNAIKNYIQAKTQEKMLREVSDTYGQAVQDTQEDLVKRIQKEVEGWYKVKLAVKDVNAVLGEFRRQFDEGVIKSAEDARKVLNELLSTYTGKDVNLAFTATGGGDLFRTTTDYLYNYYDALVELDEKQKEVFSYSKAPAFANVITRELQAQRDALQQQIDTANQYLNTIAHTEEVGAGGALITQDKVDDAKSKLAEIVKQWGIDAAEIEKLTGGAFEIKQETLRINRAALQTLRDQIQTGIWGDDEIADVNMFVQTINNELKQLDNTPFQDYVSGIIISAARLNNVSLDGLVKAFAGAEESVGDYTKRIKSAADQLTESLRLFSVAPVLSGMTEDEAKNAQKTLDVYNTLLKALGASDDKNKKSRGNKKSGNPALDRLREEIQLIQEAVKYYQELSKWESGDKAAADVRKRFRGTVAESIINNMSFDTQGQIDALNKLETLAKKAGKEGKKQLQQQLRDLKVQLQVEVGEKSVNDAKKELDKAFADYDVFKDLLGTGFDASAITTIFNKPKMDLDDLISKMEEVKAKIGDQGTEAQKVIEEYSKKLQEIQEKELLERTKKYAEYLKYQYSETTKIMLQLKNDMAEVETLNITDVQKQSINQRLQEEANKKLQEQTWKDFQGSDMYTQMFDDLSKVSTKGLDYMVERLEELKGTLNNLDPSDLKEIINQINKIKEEQIQRNPLEGLGGDIKEAWEFAKQRKELEEQITAEYKKQKTLIEQIPRQEQTTKESRKNYEKVVSVFGEDSDQAKDAKNNFSEQEKTLADMKQELSDSEKNAGKLKDQYDKGAQAAENVKNKTAEFANKINQVVDSMQTLVNGLNSVFNMSDAFNDTMSSIMEFGTNMASTVQSAGAAYASFATGDIFGGITQSVSAIGGLFSSIGSLFNIGDKKKEREIQRQIEKVNELQNAYEKLYDTIQNGLSLKVFSDNAQLTENLQKQIRSYQQMIAAEEDKKHSDEGRIKEWQENISDLYDQIAELYDSMKEELVGNFKSLSEQLADSLVSAFENGEDAAESWGDTVKQAIVNILQNLLVMKYIEPQVQKILDNLFSQAMPKTSAAEKVSERLAEKQEEYTKLLNERPDDNKRKEQLEKEIKQLQEQYDALNEKAEGEIPNITEGMVDSTIGQLIALQDSVINSPIADIIQGLIDDIKGDDELSSLQRGIQGITETQADALAAILESMRFYVADENDVIHNIYNTLIATDATSNPMLAELQSQTTLIRSIEGMMSSVIKVSGGKGRVLRVELV